MVAGGCNNARADGIDWLWAAPCCISWENDTDLTEIMNAMYRWYANSTRCYAYLHDVRRTLRSECNKRIQSDDIETVQDAAAPHVVGPGEDDVVVVFLDA